MEQENNKIMRWIFSLGEGKTYVESLKFLKMVGGMADLLYLDWEALISH
jgi:hypothetical protein